jgi:hypothetical protein
MFLCIFQKLKSLKIIFLVFFPFPTSSVHPYALFYYLSNLIYNSFRGTTSKLITHDNSLLMFDQMFPTI